MPLAAPEGSGPRQDHDLAAHGWLMRAADHRINSGTLRLELHPQRMAPLQRERLWPKALDLGRMRGAVDADELERDLVALSDDDLARRPHVGRDFPATRRVGWTHDVA